MTLHAKRDAQITALLLSGATGKQIISQITDPGMSAASGKLTLRQFYLRHGISSRVEFMAREIERLRGGGEG